MPTPVPPLRFTHAAQVHAAAHGGMEALRGELVENLTWEFRLDEDEPDVDDLTEIFFHTFVASDGQEFLVVPDGDGLKVDLCERREVRIPGNALGFDRACMPEPFTPPEDGEE